MRRAIGMASQVSKKLTDRAVITDGVGHGFDPREPVAPIRAGGEDTVIVVARLDVGLLDVVKTVLAVGPNVDLRPFDWRTVKITDDALKQARLAPTMRGDVGSHRAARRIIHMERSQHRILGRARGPSIVDRVDKHRDVQNVRQKNVFLPAVAADLTGLGQEIDRRARFILRRLDVFDERMKMGHQALHHIRGAVRDVTRHPGVHGLT